MIKLNPFGIYLLVFLLLLSGCGQSRDVDHATAVKFDQAPPSKGGVSCQASWPYPFVFWDNGQTYMITNTLIENDEVGGEIGQVKRDISSFDLISIKDDVNEQPYVKQDGDSNALAVGSKIYAFKDVDDRDVIVVNHNDKYVKAFNTVRCPEGQCIDISGETDDSDPERDMGEIYQLALDAYLPLWKGLIDDMKYIAIDMSNLTDLSDKDKKQILEYFSKYNVDIIDSNLEQLEEKGLVKDASSIDGVLLRVESTEILENKVTIKGSVYKSAKGAIGTLVEVEFLNGKWQVTKANDTWIS
ncbi:hypothetical protein [Paenibacillus sp. PAMC21692]|uniref:hypothetical protein n=1 Tax=Paenibacillus sp. PAMC21692 TaxID=2762320 RepID=UPI00164D6681|nr:hypothetical protein [Paenibacillus sp. PAMC21692]QNK57101.1 hypothetical protein H7F31_32220 [Paenibacillus sp. PAMC21692]